MMSKKVECPVDRLVEKILKRFRDWRLFGAYAMLRIPSPYRDSTSLEYTFKEIRHWKGLHIFFYK